MKIRIISSKEDIAELNSDEKLVHVAFRPSGKDLLNILNNCKNLKAIHTPTSYNRTLSVSMRMMLEMRGVEILEGDFWGHRSDINEYYEVKPAIIEKIKSGGTIRDTGLGKDFIEYIKNN